MMDNISKDLDVYSVSHVKNYSTLNLTLNPLNEEASSLIGISVDTNIDAMQFHKAQLFLKTKESCGLKRNKPCG